MINRRSVSLGGGLGLILASRRSHGQAGKPLRRGVGVIVVSTEAVATPFRTSFTDGMRELGWIDGTNFELQYVYANGDVTRLDNLVGEMISHHVDVMVVTASATVDAVRRTNTSTPVVFTALSNVVGNGFVATLARPGGNMTGISNQYEDVLDKLVETLHIVASKAKRVALLVNETNHSHDQIWAVMKRDCARLRLIPFQAGANSVAQMDRAMQEILRQRAEAVIVEPDPLFLSERIKLQTLIQATRLPVAFGYREHVLLGGLLSYGANLAASFHQAAKYVDKILKGAKPADLPIEQPTKFELVINLKTARELGLTIPQTVLLRADEVIE